MPGLIRYPEKEKQRPWIPAFAGMTDWTFSGMTERDAGMTDWARGVRTGACGNDGVGR